MGLNGPTGTTWERFYVPCRISRYSTAPVNSYSIQLTTCFTEARIPTNSFWTRYSAQPRLQQQWFKKIQKNFSCAFINLVKLGVGTFFFQNPIHRKVFNFSCKTFIFAGLRALFEQKTDNFDIFQKMRGQPVGTRRHPRLIVNIKCGLHNFFQSF